jgi:hypothetical protein
MSRVRRGTHRRGSPEPGHVALVAVAVAYAATVLVRTSMTMPLAWDEAVYASQVAGDVPAAHFSAHRSRGMSLLLAPVATVTAAVPPLRLFLAVLSGVLLYGAFRPWLRIFGAGGVRAHAYLPAVAAGLFGTLWITVLYGSMAYPNLWLAFALTAGVGLAMRPATGPGTAGGLLIAFAAASLLRPTDATAVAGLLLAAGLLVPRWRRPLPLAAVAGGVAVGWAAWAVEGYARFGGPQQRWRSGAGAVDEGGWTWNLHRHLAALDGPYLLCTGPRMCQDVSLAAAAWWLVLPVLLGLGLVAAIRATPGWQDGPAGPLAATTACGLAAAAPYLLLIDHVAPRFLLPAYSLLAPVAAYGLVWLVDRRRVWARGLATGAVLALLAGHVLVQQDLLGRTRDHQEETTAVTATRAGYLRDVAGVATPCLVVGEGALEHGYLLRCRAHPATGATLAEHEQRITEAVSRGEAVVVRLRKDAPVPGFLAGWRKVRLPGDEDHLAYLPS